MGVGGQCHAWVALPPRKKPATHCKGQNYGSVCDRGWEVDELGQPTNI